MTDLYAEDKKFMMLYLWPGEMVHLFLSELGMIDDVCICIGTTKLCQAATSYRMDDMTLSQLLPELALSWMRKKCSKSQLLQLVSGKQWGPLPTTNHHNNMTCYRCSDCNHFIVSSDTERHSRPHLGLGNGFCPTACPERGSPVMVVLVNGVKHIALVNLNCLACCLESRQQVDMLTANRKILQNWEHEISVGNDEIIKVNILIVDSKLLVFDLLLGMDIIKKLGRVHITKLGKVCFCNAPNLCRHKNL